MTLAKQILVAALIALSFGCTSDADFFSSPDSISDDQVGEPTTPADVDVSPDDKPSEDGSQSEVPKDPVPTEKPNTPVDQHDDDTPSSEDEEDLLDPFSGRWYSECMQQGSFGVRILSEVRDMHSYVGNLFYEDASCSGNPTLVDNDGNPIADVAEQGVITVLDVAGIPAGQYLIEVNVGSEKIVVFIHAQTDSFQELVGLPAGISNYEDLTALSDVSGLLADIENFQPSSFMRLNFSRGTALGLAD